MGAVLTVAVLAAALIAVHRPFGDYLFRVVSGTRHSRVERGVYRLVGVDPAAAQTWSVYARSVLAFSVVSILFLYGFLRLLDKLPADLAWNTAVSFATNTDWQSYAGESTMSTLGQMAGLTVQNFVSASVGIAVAVALVRGFAAVPGGRLGNFWVDLVRITLRVLLPVSALAAVVFIAAGSIQDLSGGAVASQEAIKLLGTNGGGFFNANSAHPYENPTALTNLIQMFLILLIPFSLPRVFGRMSGQKRQGHAIVAVMGLLAMAGVVLANVAEAGGGMEGKEVRFGVSGSATYAAVTTLTSTGATNSAHDSYTAFGGMVPLVDMMLGEVAPGGVGSGLYGLLVLAVVTVFVAGLMVGRTPEYLGKKIGTREIQLVSLYLLVTPAIVLTGTAAAFATGHDSAALNSGPHGLTEVLYAFTSAGNNNGSAFAGLSANEPWWNTALGLAMLAGRFLPIVLVLALAGALAERRAVPESAGTLPTHKPLFVGLVAGVTVVLVALTFLPALALGPLAEGLS